MRVQLIGISLTKRTGSVVPIGPEDLAPLFPMALIEQETSPEREIAFPEEVRGALAQWRPTPLFRAHAFERAIGTRSHVYYKYEGVSPAGSHNFSGIALPFMRDKLNGKNVRLLAAEPTSCPTLTKGKYTFDFGDGVGMTPIVKMHTLGHDFMPPGIHAGGLRYHGAAPLVSRLVDEKTVEGVAYGQVACFEAAVAFVRSEGILPAPESSHAIKAAIDEAKRADAEGKTRVILFNLSGHGHFDLAANDAYFAGELEDFAYPEEAVARSMKNLPVVEA